MAALSERQIRWFLGGIAAFSFALLVSLEVVTETDEIELLDVVVDAVALLLQIGTAVGLVLLIHRMQRQHEEKISLIRELEVARVEGNEWRNKAQTHLNGLRDEMSLQFERWSMSAAEKDVGMLILKGLSHKEISTLRGTTEATVRQQAQSIYQKSNLPGKTAFSAYFLEDLMISDAAEEPLRRAG